MQEGKDLLAHNDGFFLLARSNSFNEDDDAYSAMLIDTDLQGMQKWSVLLNGLGNTTPRILKADSQNNLYILGSTAPVGSSQSSVFLAKTTSQGTIAWEQNINPVGSANTQGVDFLLANNELLVLCQTTRSADDSYYFIQKYEPANGSPLGEPIFFFDGINEKETPLKLFPTDPASGDFVVFGNTSQENRTEAGAFGGLNIRVLEFNVSSKGRAIYSGIFGENGDELLLDVTRTAGGTFLALGVKGQGSLARSGFIIAFKRVETAFGIDYEQWWRLSAQDLMISSSTDSEIVSAAELPNGNLRILINLAANNSDNRNYRIIEISPFGEIVNANVLTFGGNGDDIGVKVLNGQENESVILGNLDFQNSNTLIFLQKISF